MGAAPEKEGTRARAKREQVLEGARRVFLREGFAASSTDAIAREAGVSKRTLYSYYPSKEDLFAEVLRALTVENPRTRVLDFVRGAEPESPEELRGALVGLAKKVASTMMDPEYLALLRTIIADSHRFPQLGEIFRSTVPERGLGEVRAMLKRAQENGVVVVGDPEVMTRMFMGTLLTYTMIDGLFRPGRPRPPAPEKIEEMVDLYLKAVTDGKETERGKA
jgi:TetR/AcrR family transcriptional repressor of mexJK operon